MLCLLLVPSFSQSCCPFFLSYNCFGDFVLVNVPIKRKYIDIDCRVLSSCFPSLPIGVI